MLDLLKAIQLSNNTNETEVIVIAEYSSILGSSTTKYFIGTKPCSCIINYNGQLTKKTIKSRFVLDIDGIINWINETHEKEKKKRIEDGTYTVSFSYCDKETKNYSENKELRLEIRTYYVCFYKSKLK